MSGLTKVDESEVRSSDGFSIKYERESMTYVEGDRYIVIPVEHLGDPYELVVYLDQAAGWLAKGRPAGDIDRDHRKVLHKRVEACLRVLDRNFSVRS